MTLPSSNLLERPLLLLSPAIPPLQDARTHTERRPLLSQLPCDRKVLLVLGEMNDNGRALARRVGGFHGPGRAEREMGHLGAGEEGANARGEVPDVV